MGNNQTSIGGVVEPKILSYYIENVLAGAGKAFWGAEVTKMMKACHAPVSDADAKAIADYLATAY